VGTVIPADIKMESKQSAIWKLRKEMWRVMARPASADGNPELIALAKQTIPLS